MSFQTVMVTSHGQEQMMLDAIKAGAKGYVLKPFTTDKLHQVIHKVIARCDPRQP